jgi:catechol 2,3-dioxygenase-like lactoylglutathione lyase family enzyme
MLRLGSIVIHCFEFERTVAFWRGALGYEPREPASDDWVVLRDPKGRGPNLSFQKRESTRERHNWIHLDLYADDAAVEVERLLALGARRYPWRYRPGADFVVLADPDDNLFCVVQRELSPPAS